MALIDAQCRLVAQADHIPVHVGAMPWAAKALVEVFPTPSRNDVYLLNDPYRGGSHLPDLTAFVPVFDGPTLMFWSVVRAHHSDIGGATHGAYNPAATEIYHEGLRLPPMRLTENGVLRKDLLDMLALNVRHPRDFLGDLAAQIGAARLGEQRLNAVIAEFGGATLAASVEAMLDAAERHARDIVASWRDGVYDGDRLAGRRRLRHHQHRDPRQGHQAGQRCHRRSVRLRSAGGRLRQFLTRQHAVRGHDGVRLPARPRHRQERRRVPPAARWCSRKAPSSGRARARR